MKGYWILSVITLGIILFSVTAYAQSSAIPDWVKNNAKWWSEGQIGESDYISSLQYLINQGIIKIPIKQVVATDTAISDEIRAHSLVVRILFPGESEYQTFHSFSMIVEVGDTVSSPGKGTPELFLVSIPSLDKKPLYEIVGKTLRSGGAVTTMQALETNFAIDVIAKDGSLIETVEYRKCKVADYYIYVDQWKDRYRFSNVDGPEIREVTDLVCTGYDVIVP